MTGFLKSSKVALVFIIGATFILLALSAWQFQRLEWKQDIIQKLDSEYQKDPTQHRYDFDFLQKLSEQNKPIKYGSITGGLMPHKTMLFGPKPRDGKAGFHVVTPVRIDKGYILVNRGWISEENKDKLKDETSLANRAMTGLIRKPEWNMFTPNNNAEADIWTKLDIDMIAKAKELNPAAPVILYSERSTNPLIETQAERWYPRNKHLYYAIFWLTMALALWGVSGAYYLKNKRA